MPDDIKPPAGYTLDAQAQVTPPAGYTLDPADNTVPRSSGMDFVKAVGGAAKDAVEGFGSGVANTVVGTRDLVNKGTKAIGMGEIPDVPAVLREAGTTPPNASAAFSVGKVGEQIGEFFVPGTTVGKIGEAVNFGGKLGHVAEAATRVAGESIMAGGHAGMQSHGDTDTMRNAALSAGLFTAPFVGVNAALKAVKPGTLYAPERFLSTIPDRFKGERFNEIVGQAIDDGITISKNGLNQAKAVEKGGQNTRDALINANANTLIDLNTVRQPLLEFKNLALQLGETNVARQIDKRLAAIEDIHGGQPGTPPGTVTMPAANPNATLHPSGMPTVINTPGIPPVPAKITVAKAQELKNFAQSLAAPMYERTSESVGTQKIRELLGNGFMKAIEEQIPQVKGMNRSIQNTKVIRQGIEDYINSNPSIVNMNTLLWSIMSPKLAAVSLLANPRVRSSLAVAAHANAVSNVGSAMGRVAGGTASQLAPEIPSMPVGVP